MLDEIGDQIQTERNAPLKRLKEICIYISMSIIEKVFKYEATELPVIKYEDQIWFKAVAIATILKYTNQRKAFRDHVDPEDKRKLSELMSKSKWNESFRLKTDPLKGNEGNSLYLSELGLYSLVLRSKLESAKEFKRWVTSQVLPSIQKTGKYDYCMNHKYNNKKRSLTQLNSRKQVIAFQDRVITINIKEAQHPLKREKQVIDKSSIMLKILTKSMHRVLV